MMVELRLAEIFNILTLGGASIHVPVDVEALYQTRITYDKVVENISLNTWNGAILYKGDYMAEFNSDTMTMQNIELTVSDKFVSDIFSDSLRSYSNRASRLRDFLTTLGLPVLQGRVYVETTARQYVPDSREVRADLHIRQHNINGGIEIEMNSNRLKRKISMTDADLRDAKYAVEKYREWTNPSLTDSV